MVAEEDRRLDSALEAQTVGGRKQEVLPPVDTARQWPRTRLPLN